MDKVEPVCKQTYYWKKSSQIQCYTRVKLIRYFAMKLHCPPVSFCESSERDKGLSPSPNCFKRGVNITSLDKHETEEEIQHPPEFWGLGDLTEHGSSEHRQERLDLAGPLGHCSCKCPEGRSTPRSRGWGSSDCLASTKVWTWGHWYASRYNVLVLLQ